MPVRSGGEFNRCGALSGHAIGKTANPGCARFARDPGLSSRTPLACISFHAHLKGPRLVIERCLMAGQARRLSYRMKNAAASGETSPRE